MRDIDHIIERLKAELPDVKVTHPGADADGIWFIRIPGRDGEVQMESSDGSCPFVILTDDRSYGRSIDEVVQTITRLRARDILKREFAAEKGSFLIQLRCQCEWDWDAFRRLTSAMYDIAEEAKGQPSIETWIAEGFWLCDTLINDIASHSNFSRFPEDAYRDAVGLIHSLAYLLFSGQNTYPDDTLRKKARG